MSPPGTGAGRQMGRKTEKARNFRSSAARLVGLFAPHRVPVVFILIISLAASAFSIAGPRLLGMATQMLYQGAIDTLNGTGRFDREGFITLILILAAIYAASSLATFLSGFLLSGITEEITRKLRSRVNETIHTVPLRTHDRYTPGEIVSRVSNDIDALGQSLNQSAIQIITSITTMIGVLIMMLSISVLMTLITLIIFPISIKVISLIVNRSQSFFASRQKTLGEINSQVEEAFSGHTVIKAFNGEDSQKQLFAQRNQELYESSRKSQFLSALMMPVMQSIGNISYVFIALSGGFLVVQGRINVGEIQAFIQYMRNFTQPLNLIAQVSSMIQTTVAAAERVFAFIDEEKEQDIEDPEEIRGPVHSIEFREVSFGYTPHNPVIESFSLSVQKGDTIAIVGPTGAGKTTIVKLLMDFYRPDSGEILINGIPLTRISKESLRQKVAMVLQDTWLFEGTIRDNIIYGNEQAGEEEILNAAQKAQIEHFIHTLPGGYDMMLSEDSSNISQGQRQLITIARALVRNPDVLILDEATSSVDTRTEVLIQKAMDNVLHQRTNFIIAHRLSTIVNADLILVMDKGAVVEQGTHRQLLETGKLYAELYRNQFQPEQA